MLTLSLSVSVTIILQFWKGHREFHFAPLSSFSEPEMSVPSHLLSKMISKRLGDVNLIRLGFSIQCYDWRLEGTKINGLEG